MDASGGSDPLARVFKQQRLIEPQDQALVASEVESALFGDARPVVLGRYRLEARVGQGGGGIVYRASDPQLQRTVAVKLFRSQGDRVEVQRLRQEGRAIAKIRHPNVVEVYDVLDAGRGVAIVMEWIDGVALDDWLRAGDRDQPTIVSTFVAAGRGLAAVHGAGWAHRDFKPSNVMIARNGRIKLVDFGLALHLRHRPSRPTPPSTAEAESGDDRLRLTRPGAIPGTRAYMAPEALGGARQDAAGDQYAYCASLFEALVGELPRQGVKVPASVGRHVQQALGRGLHRDPSRRFRSMTALLDALQPRPVLALLRGGVRRRVGVAVAVLFLGAGLSLGLPKAPDDADTIQRLESIALERTLRGRHAEAQQQTSSARFDEGVRVLRAVVHDARRAGLRTLAIEAQRSLGQALVHQGRVEEGVRVLTDVYERAVAAELEPEAADVASGLVFAVGYMLGDYEGALPWARHAQALLDRQQARGLAQARLDAHMGSVEAMAGNFEAAERHHRRAEQVRREHAEEAGSELGSTLSNLGNLMLLQQRYEEALRFHEEALEIRRGVLGDAHPDIAVSHCSIAAIHMLQDRYAEGEPMLLRALQIWSDAVGPDHRDLIHPLHNLSVAAAERSAFDEAESYARRALRIAEAQYGTEDRRVASMKMQLGRVLGRQGRYAEALEALFAAEVVVAGPVETEHSDAALIRFNIGAAYFEMGRYREALRYNDLALEHWRVRGDDHGDDVPAAQLRAARAEIELQRWAAARTRLEQLLVRPDLDDAGDRATIESLLARTAEALEDAGTVAN
ncbi:MAG: serine/threonine-protein kinase [Myxococcota bacterium]